MNFVDFRFRIGLAGALALALLLAAASVSAQGGNPCRAAMSCDCLSIQAGLNTGPWRSDCRSCEAKILEKCAQSYANHRDMERALNEAGFCRRDCSAFGPGAFPNEPPKKAGENAAAPNPSMARLGEMRLLCAGNAAPKSERIGELQFTGCKDKQGRRNGLWKAHEAGRKLVVEILYQNGREVSRRELPAS
jgi:hypothetical protein